jgi:cysteine-rich repeat protein
VLATCNDGAMDPGEDCDDGNADSKDQCTTSCTPNSGAVHAACTVLDEMGMEVEPFFNISEGDIQNCDNVELVTGAEVGCNRSWEYIGNNQVFAPGGDCQLISIKCDGDLCPPGPIGDFDAHESCPAGHVLINKVIEGAGAIPTIRSKVCLLACETDRDCRWNEADAYWMGPGEFRCRTTPLSGGERVCNDPRNNAL